MKSAASQRGLSLVGWLVALFVVGFLATTAFKVVPHYMDYLTLKKIISAIDADRNIPVNSVDELYSQISKGMQVNNIRNMDLKSVLSITEQREQYLAHLKYENREPLIENLDLVVKFDHEFSVRKP